MTPDIKMKEFIEKYWEGKGKTDIGICNEKTI
jgi:hypothetical protein